MSRVCVASRVNEMVRRYGDDLFRQLPQVARDLGITVILKSVPTLSILVAPEKGKFYLVLSDDMNSATRSLLLIKNIAHVVLSHCEAEPVIVTPSRSDLNSEMNKEASLFVSKMLEQIRMRRDNRFARANKAVCCA